MPRPTSLDDPHFAAVQIDQLPYQRQAYSRALVRASVLTLDAMKALENVRQFAGRNTDASVADCQLDGTAGIAKLNADRRLRM